jgi:hypothetical protein
VQRQQDPKRRHQKQRHDDILGIGGQRRPDQQGRDHQSGLLYPRDLPFGGMELHRQPHGEDDSNQGAVAKIGDRTGNPLDRLEPCEAEGDEAEGTHPEPDHENRSPNPERDTPSSRVKSHMHSRRLSPGESFLGLREPSVDPVSFRHQAHNVELGEGSNHFADGESRLAHELVRRRRQKVEQWTVCGCAIIA